MKCNRRLGVVLLGVLLGNFSPARAQQIRSATWNTDQFILRYRTMVEPPRPSSQELHIGGGGIDDSKTQHRILQDSQQKKYFGYDLNVDSLGGGTFQLTFKPLTIPSLDVGFFALGPDWSELPMPSIPATMQVNDGETVALDLLVNPATGEKIVEYITVNAKPKSSANANPPADLQLSDIRMSLMSPTLHVNGKSREWNHGDAHGSASGAILWVYVPDRGRFLLSFTPHLDLGFRQAGQVRGSNIKFTWNSETYELRTAGNVIPADGAWNLYVYQDTGYQPEGYPPTLYGAGDKPEHLFQH
jgi:hypothetical protein